MISAGAELTRKLVSFNTINPPGNERDCVEYLAGELKALGCETECYPFGPGRANLVARLPAKTPSRKPLVFSGHVDTVPLGQAPWSVPPFEGVIRDGRMFGRGTTDMKSGIAAFIVATKRLAEVPDRKADIVHVITAGEETGSEGAAWLADRPALLGECGALIVAEPTGNRPLVGHKGALWLHIGLSGVTAHGSMPEKGVNAIVKATRVIERLLTLDFGHDAHPVMGLPSMNIGTISGGLNINSVPDRAVIGIDIRSIAGQKNADLKKLVVSTISEQQVDIETIVDLDPVYSDPNDSFIRDVFSTVSDATGSTPGIGTANYFTDASFLTPAYGAPPTIILGPGNMGMAHQTDEYCELDKIDECANLFTAIGRKYLS